MLLEPSVGKAPELGPAQQHQGYLPVEHLQFALDQR